MKNAEDPEMLLGTSCRRQLLKHMGLCIVRATTGTPQKNDHLEKRIVLEDTVQNEYVTNIQIADLNALNAMLAVIKWKKWTGFYQDLKNEHNTTYSINTAQLINEDHTT